MAGYRALIVAALVFFVAFWGVELAAGDLGVALVLGLVLGGGAGLVTRALLPPNPELETYEDDVRRRIRGVHDTTDEIRRMSAKVQDPVSKGALQEGCQVIRDLLTFAQERDPGNMAATAAKIGVYVTSVKNALEVHLQIEENPEYWTGAQELLAGDREGFVAFREFALTSVRQLNHGEVMSLRADLATLRPMRVPELGGGPAT